MDNCAGVSTATPSAVAGHVNRPRSSRLAWSTSPWPPYAAFHRCYASPEPGRLRPPQQLDEVAALAPERIHGTTERVLPQPLLYQRGEPVEALGHIHDAGRQIHADIGSRAKDPNSASTALSTRASIGGARRTRSPLGPTTSTTPGLSGSGRAGAGTLATSTGTSAGASSCAAGTATSSRSSRRPQR